MDEAAHPRERVVVISAMNAPGAREYLAKPIDLGQLLDTVGRLTS
jgi:hypothetical protein